MQMSPGGGEETVEGFTDEELKFLMKKFKRIDKDASGELEVDELMGVFIGEGSPLTRRVIGVLDDNKDQKISFAEFMKGLTTIALAANSEKRVELLFKIYDMDDDGFISNGDLFKAMVLLTGGNLNAKNLQQLVDKTFQQGDTDGDGLLSLDEFKVIISNDMLSSSKMRVNVADYI